MQCGMRDRILHITYLSSFGSMNIMAIENT